MKPLLLLASLLGCLAVNPAVARECKGDDPCKACRDCSACKYCDPKNPKGGSCGVLRDQGGDAARKRVLKRGR